MKESAKQFIEDMASEDSIKNMSNNKVLSNITKMFKDAGKRTDTKEFYAAVAYTALLSLDNSNEILDEVLEGMLDEDV